MELIYELKNIDAAADELLSTGEHHYVWALEGDMGSGKTTLIHVLCEKLGLTGTFGSPTFSIINEYTSRAGVIFHIDLYRCKNEEEAIRAGVEDCLYSGNRCFVEWPSRAKGIFPENTFKVYIKVEDETTRRIETRVDDSISLKQGHS